MLLQQNCRVRHTQILSELIYKIEGASQIERNQSPLAKSKNQQLKEKLGRKWTTTSDVMTFVIFDTLQQSFEKLVDQLVDEVLMSYES